MPRAVACFQQKMPTEIQMLPDYDINFLNFWRFQMFRRAATFPLFSSYRCWIHRGRHFEDGMSRKDSRDDSEGPASSQKLNYLYLHFEIHSTKA